MTSNPFELTGHRALITGGTQGVGAAIAKSVARAGADVLLVGLRDDDSARDTLDQCRGLGVRAELVTADMSMPPDTYLADLMARAENALPGIDLLVNNAGTCIDVPFEQMDFARYLTTIHLNVTAGYFLTQAFVRTWIQSNVAGRVVFTGSINGLLAEPVHTAYDASKGAVAALVRSLCASLAPQGIRVNAMAPGLVRTPLTDALNQIPALDAWMQLHTPNGNVPGPEVCGDTVVFLLSDAASHIHGQTILVDGGMSAWQQPDPPPSWQTS